jgi:hypothetical protein
MKIEVIKNINITVLFSAPINHLLVSQETLLNMFKSGDQQKDQHNFIEAPGLKVAAFPNLKKDIVFEANRFLINNKNEAIEETQIVDDLQKIINSSMIEKDKVVAYGFNYDTIVYPQNSDFKISDLIGAKISEIEGVKSAGINILYEKNNITYGLEIKPINSGDEEKKFLAHFNAHFNKNELPVRDELVKDVTRQYNEFKNIIEKI